MPTHNYNLTTTSAGGSAPTAALLPPVPTNRPAKPHQTPRRQSIAPRPLTPAQSPEQSQMRGSAPKQYSFANLHQGQKALPTHDNNLTTTSGSATSPTLTATDALPQRTAPSAPAPMTRKTPKISETYIRMPSLAKPRLRPNHNQRRRSRFALSVTDGPPQRTASQPPAPRPRTSPNAIICAKTIQSRKYASRIKSLANPR